MAQQTVRLEDLVRNARRWLVSRAALERQVDALHQDNVQLREKITGLQKAKVVADKRIEELRREKDNLRAKVAEHKKSVDSIQRVMDQVNEKIADLREENEKLRRSKKR